MQVLSKGCDYMQVGDKVRLRPNIKYNKAYGDGFCVKEMIFDGCVSIFKTKQYEDGYTEYYLIDKQNPNSNISHFVYTEEMLEKI